MNTPLWEVACDYDIEMMELPEIETEEEENKIGTKEEEENLNKINSHLLNQDVCADRKP